MEQENGQTASDLLRETVAVALPLDRGLLQRAVERENEQTVADMRETVAVVLSVDIGRAGERSREKMSKRL